MESHSSFPRFISGNASGNGPRVLGYRKYFTALKDYLSLHVSNPSRLELVSREDKVVTGNFEVTVVDTGQVLHSKRHAGQGRAESVEAKALIVEQINDLIADLDDESVGD
jgi:hypothetical protein